MLKLVVIDLNNADIGQFVKYEKQALALLDKYGAKLELGLRSVDGKTETHVLYFPDSASFDNYLSDPARMTLQDDWKLTGAITTIADVERIDYLTMD